MFRPEDEEFGEEFGDLLTHAILVDARAQVGFRCPDGCVEVELPQGAGFRGLAHLGQVEDFEETRGEGGGMLKVMFHKEGRCSDVWFGCSDCLFLFLICYRSCDFIVCVILWSYSSGRVYVCHQVLHM